MIYNSRFIHKIAPKDTDTGPCIEIDLEALKVDASISSALLRRTLGRILRDSRCLIKGQRLWECRIEDGGAKIVCFPEASIWHSIILTEAK